MEKGADTDKEEEIKPHIRGKPAFSVGYNCENDPQRRPVRGGPMPEDSHFQKIRHDRAEYCHKSGEVPSGHRVDGGA